MNRALTQKVNKSIKRLREIWTKFEGKKRFVAFSTGKDSLAMAAMLYEAVAPEKPICLYAHHNMEFPVYQEYLEELKQYGFELQTVNPFLDYFELMDRGIEFTTLTDAWCVPMLVGTGLMEWLQKQGVRGPRSGVMFRGMSGSEYSHKYHREVEVYNRLDLPCVNPMLEYSKEEILTIIKERYNLPLNPIYNNMDRTYCICCYTSDKRRQAYSATHYPKVCKKYYGQIDKLLFKSGLLKKSALEAKYKTREEKLDRHGFVYWRRTKMQNTLGAIKKRHPSGLITYRIRNAEWINTKHLEPAKGKWLRRGDEIRFWDLPENVADTLIKRMINCLDCGYCVVECFSCRAFDRKSKTLRIDGCTQCGTCIRVKFCMGWKHRFWRRVIREDITDVRRNA